MDFKITRLLDYVPCLMLHLLDIIIYENIYRSILRSSGSHFKYRSGTVNSNTVNSKFHLIRSFFEIFARFLLFHVKNAQLIQTQLIQGSTNSK